MKKTLLIIGLGNPGLAYRNSRHNSGFMVLDTLAVKLNVRFTRFQAKALLATSAMESNKIILAKPQTYMNLSGQSVQELVRFYKIISSDIFIVYDDIYLPLGKIRIRADGGSGGHQGVNSIIDRIGISNFPRLRIGIGSPPGQMRAEDYVLDNFPDSEMQLLGETLSHASEAILMWVDEGINATMNKYNNYFLDT